MIRPSLLRAFRRACVLFAALGWALIPARAGILLHDTFSADGALATVNPRWTTHSGTAGQIEVASGALVLTEAESEDVNAVLEGGLVETNSPTVLYARFIVRFTALPQGTGGYFAHFKDAATGFRGRVFATTAGAASGALRLGVSSGGGSPSATVATDVPLNTATTVVLRYAVAEAASALWINPVAESDPAAMATDTVAALPIAAMAFRQSLSAGNGMGTLQVDNLVVATTFAEALAGPATGTAPVIGTQPASLSVTRGSPAQFSVVASGSEPLAYQWLRGGAPVAGATSALFHLAAVADTDAGVYSVTVTNAFGSVTSQEATLTVTPPSGPARSTLAQIRRMVDPTTYAPTNTTQIVSAEGVVITHTNVTTAANALFYIQDETAGIAVFVTGGSTLRPKAGDRVAVTGPLGVFNGLLQFNLSASNPAHSVTVLGTGQPLPAPKPLDFALQSDPAAMFDLTGSLVVVSGVTLDLTQPNFTSSTSGGNVTLTDAGGQTLTLRVDGRVGEILGQPKPTTPVDIIGVLAIFDSSAPYTSGYQILPTRLADIVGAAAAPQVAFTNTLELLVAGDAPVNTFPEVALRPGERLELAVTVTSPDAAPVRVTTPAEGLPAGAAWTTPGGEGTRVEAAFSWRPTPSDAGTRLVLTLIADGSKATNRTEWIVYVPTAAEQAVVITEFSANAPGANDTPYGNLLGRAETPPSPNSDDEFVELTNLGTAPVNLRNWSIADGAQVRHRFYNAFEVPAKTSAVVYGGPLNGFEPQLDVPIAPASENAFGFGLNNSGGDSLWLRNAAGHLVSRIVYSTLSTNSTMTRYPGTDSAFVPHLGASGSVASPGRRFDGQTYAAPPVQITAPALTAARLPGGMVRLTWNAATGARYSVLAAPSVTGPFAPIAAGITSDGGTAQFDDPSPAVAARFYRLSVP